VVAPLPAPTRPLKGGRAWTWQWREPSKRSPWGWCRIYHRSTHTPDGVAHRTYGPLHRLDHHIPDRDGRPQESRDGRSVLYVAGNLPTALGEVFGDYPEAAVCPNYRIALVRPAAPIRVLDLRGQGAAMRIGALPSLATGDYPRASTQEWARAIYEDQPVARKTVRGAYYGAAHTNGPAVALWDTDGDVEVLKSGRGQGQDIALADPRMWPRVVTAAVGLRMRADLVSRCPACR
jgi:hypothetical protein